MITADSLREHLQNVLFLSPQMIGYHVFLKPHHWEPLGEEHCQEVAVWGPVGLVWILWLGTGYVLATLLSRGSQGPGPGKR